MSKTRICLVAFLVACGAIWTVLLPKTADVLRPDFVISAAIGLALICSGLLLVALQRKSLALNVVSVLANASLLALVRQAAGVLQDFAEEAKPAMPVRVVLTEPADALLPARLSRTVRDNAQNPNLAIRAISIARNALRRRP